MNSIFQQVVTAIALLSIIGILVYVVIQQQSIINSVDSAAKEQKFLKDNITRIESSLLTEKAFNEKLKTLNMDLAEIKKDLAKVGGEIDQIIISEGKTPGGTGTGLPSSGTIPISDTPVPVDTSTNTNACYKDPYGYLKNIQLFTLKEPLNTNSSIPFGEMSFDATKAKPWGYKVYPRTYISSVVIATDASGGKRAYSKISIKPDDGSNKIYDLPQVEVKYYEKLPEAKMHWWNPRATVGFDIGWSSKPQFASTISAQVFTSSYGKLKQSPSFKFVGVGLGYNIPSSTYSVVVSPFTYKITGDKSIFQSINIGPSVAVDNKGDFQALGGVRLAL